MATPEEWKSVGVMKKTSGSLADTALDKDRAAYRRLRKNGLQPPHLTGSAELETRAETQMEIDSGSILNAEQRKQAQEGIARAEEIRFG